MIGELEYEVGAALRNPLPPPQLFLSEKAIESRIRCFGDELHLDPARRLAWTFAQAVLSAVWRIEDGFEVRANHPWILVAELSRPMLRSGHV